MKKLIFTFSFLFIFLLAKAETTLDLLTTDTIVAVNDDTLTTNLIPVTIDIFSNDSFCGEPNNLIFGIVDGVDHGTLVINIDATVTYLAEPSFCEGIDSFTYFISNGTINDTATVTIQVDCGTNTIEVLDEVSIQVFPNPVKDHMTVQMELKKNMTLQLNVINLLGKTMVSEQLDLSEGINTLEINTADWPTGVYFLNLNDKERGITKKIIKN